VILEPEKLFLVASQKSFFTTVFFLNCYFRSGKQTQNSFCFS
jgi:hypothetical protein